MLQTMQTNFDITSVNMKDIHFKYSKLMKTPQASRDMVPTKCKTKNIYVNFIVVEFTIIL